MNLYGRAALLLDPTDPARLAILPDLGVALDSAGRFDDSRACFAEAVRLAEAAGDRRTLAYARVAQCLSEFESDPADRLRVADEAAAVFEPLGDDRGLSLSWQIRADTSWAEGRAAGFEAGLARALEHARRAGAHREEGLIVYSLGMVLVQGPTPVPDAIERCRNILALAPDDRGIEMAMDHALAHLHAHLGQFELARPLAARCQEIAAESGQRAEAVGLTEVAWDVETLAGDHEAAERIIADGCERLAAMGGSNPLLDRCLAQSRLTLGRAVDIDRLNKNAAQSTGWLHANRMRVVALARAAAGDLDEAEAQAREAVLSLSTTDMIVFHAEAVVTLGDVLRAAGRASEADASFRQALDLYRQKGSLVGADTVKARLAG